MKLTGVIVASGVLLWAAAVRADLKVTTETIMTMGEMSSKTTSLRAVKPNFERYESATKSGADNAEVITIRVCDKKQTIKLDAQLKIYAVVPDAAPSAPGKAAGEKPGADKASTPATGKMTMTYAVKDLGIEEVAGFKARHYMVDTQIDKSGCAGDGTMKQQYELWISDIREPVVCPDAVVPSVAEAMSRPDCKLEVEQKGDFKLYGEIGKGLRLRDKLYNDGKLFMTTQVTSLSQAKLGDDLFTVPAGYALVSEEEFDQKISEAMVKAMSAQNN